MAMLGDADARSCRAWCWRSGTLRSAAHPQRAPCRTASGDNLDAASSWVWRLPCLSACVTVLRSCVRRWSYKLELQLAILADSL